MTRIPTQADVLNFALTTLGLKPAPTEHECVSDNADECALIRERSVAGLSDEIPTCPIHGAFPDEVTS